MNTSYFYAQKLIKNLVHYPEHQIHAHKQKTHKSSLKELLQKDKSITIHQKNLQYLTLEIDNVEMDMPPKTMNEIF